MKRLFLLPTILLAFTPSQCFQLRPLPLSPSTQPLTTHAGPLQQLRQLRRAPRSAATSLQMAAVSATLVKELREKTGAGMMDCKKALTDTEGDMEAALDILKKKGLAAAAKRAGRKASEGLVVVKADDAKGVLVEVNCETDFVARNEQFQKFALTCADIAFDKGGDFAALKAAEYPEGTEGKTVEQEVPALTGVIGEKLDLRRSAGVSLDGADGVVATYLHNPLSGNMGQIGVLVALESGGDKAKLREVGQTVAMHISVARPESVDVGGLDVSKLEKERAVLKEQARESGKPEEIIDKMVEGRLRKFYEQVVLTEQEWMLDDTKRKVSKVLKDAEGEVGGPIKVKDFKIFKLGEGVEEAPPDEA
ncbi:unnamed protein product [Vitrella brassicaformis CCMP3155]|uniref:Elongation factor Ts, mitochondrial n=1 Tax=Vitrella brassicaformis (strain CCMP3155) TaxID=1169540 RepID=A0A0G4G5U2_VITBC|nr:unnamed protein product [Vitrella brassicaformis CCMP3155]|eukprot:CEM23756.1 unnamed protein product [Vitrella brassicaformis CCMP3155]